MEDVNMSQSAEQTAIDSVPPGGLGGVKRQVSADAFRALTMRLNGKTSAAPVSPSIPSVDLEVAPQVVAEAIAVAPIPVPVPVPSVVHAGVPEVVTPAPLEQSNSPVAEQTQQPTPDQTAAQIMPAPMVVAEEVLPTQQTVELPEAEPVPGFVAEQAPVAQVSVTSTIEPSVPNIDADVIPHVENIASPAEPVVIPEQFAIPASGTRIILNAKPRPKSVIPKPLEVPEPVDIPDAIQPGDIGEVTTQMLITEPEREAVAVTIDPLQAAMNLMNATSVYNKSDEPAAHSTPSMPIDVARIATHVPLSDTAAQAISQEIAVPTVEVSDGLFVQEPQALDEKPVTVEKSGRPLRNVEKRVAKAPPVIGDAIEHPLEFEPDAKSGETARVLLDIMSSGSQPQERALAADTLLQLIPRMMVKDLVALAERVCMMEDAPSLLVKALINHREARVAGPLLEDGKVIVEQDLLRLITTTQVDRLIMMAKHRRVTQTVCDALIARGEPSVYLTLVRNPGAALSHDAFVAFNEIAKAQSSLQAPLATRGDTPPPIAFELFWSLPVELRRYVLSRFLTDSATLDKILKITQAVDGGSGELKFPPTRKVEALVGLIADGVTDQAAAMMAELGGTSQENARRIIADPDGEPLTVVLKTMGQTRAQFSQSIKKCASSSKSMLRSDRDLTELQIMFDSLSFNKARTLLTYWDWAIEKTGPYSRRVM